MQSTTKIPRDRNRDTQFSSRIQMKIEFIQVLVNLSS